MKIVKWFFIIVGVLFMIGSLSETPLAWIGFILFVFGMYQMVQKNKGKVTFSRPGLIIAAGLVFNMLMVAIFSEPTTDVSENKEEKQLEKVSKEANQEQENIEEEKANKAEEEADRKQKDQEQLALNLGLEAVTVARVVDGDTFVTSDGRKVRLVGVNTPESTTRTEEYGKEASNYTTSKLNGKQVWLQKDVSDTDRYGRSLRLVWLEIPTDVMNEEEIRNKMFNADLVINGYAEPSTYTPDVTYSEYFVKYAREARKNSTGLWAFGENGTTKGDLDKEVASKNQSNHTNSNNNNSSNAATTPSTGSEYYQNCTELRKVYPEGVASDHPAYAPKHDRDKDGWACER